jgi:hypothetical protein
LTKHGVSSQFSSVTDNAIQAGSYLTNRSFGKEQRQNFGSGFVSKAILWARRLGHIFSLIGLAHGSFQTIAV